MRFILTVAVVTVSSLFSLFINAPATLALGNVAGKQFERSDQSYLVAQGAFRLFNFTNTAIFLLTLVVLLTIWWSQIKKIFVAAMGILAALILLPTNSEAYYNQSDYTENYFILPNESAFFIPDVGDNASSQTKFGSEEYLAAKKIPAKRFEIPHAKLANSGAWSNYYVPVGRLIIVDRSPVSREWVKHPTRGTSTTDQSFPCQSSEGLDITVGVAIGASVYEEDAAKFLFRFGVNPPTGDRNDPTVIFTSVYYGKSLAQVMDGPVRSRVQSLVCDELTARTLDQNNAQAAKIMETIQKKVADYMTTVGIRLDFIGWADTFGFEKEVQEGINRNYVATQDLKVAQSLKDYTVVLQALSNANATRSIADKWNGQVPTSVSLWWLPTSISDWAAKALGPSGK